jgi:hypothetical protein
MTPVRKADFVGDESRTGDLSLAAAPVPKTVESVEHIAPRGTEVHKIRGSEVQIFRGLKLAIYICTPRLHDPLGSCRSSHGSTLPCSLLTPRGAGLSPCTERHSAGPHQAASSRATLAGGTARAAKLGIFTTAPPAQSQICDQACSRPTLSVEMMPHVRGAAARRFSTSGFSTERVGRPHAWSQPVRLRRRCRRAVVKKMPPRRSLPSFCFAGCERG